MLTHSHSYESSLIKHTVQEVEEDTGAPMATYRLTQYIKRSFNLQWNTERRNTQKLQCYFEGWRILMKTSFSKRSDCRNYVWKSSRVNWVWRFDQIWPNSITYKVQWRCNPCIKYFHHTSKKFTSNFTNEEPDSCQFLPEIDSYSLGWIVDGLQLILLRRIKKFQGQNKYWPRLLNGFFLHALRALRPYDQRGWPGQTTSQPHIIWRVNIPKKVCDTRNSDWIVC